MELGLIEGLSGRALRLFLSDNVEHVAKGKQLLSHISEYISKSEDYSFETGIVGFGWLVAFLYQEKLLEINSDEILEDFDDQIYRITIAEVAKNDLDIPVLLGLMNYHIIRHRNKNPNEIYFRKFVHSECLNLIVAKVFEFINKKVFSEQLLENESKTLCLILLKCSYCFEYFRHKDMEMLIQYIAPLIVYFEKQKNKENKYKKELSLLYYTTINRNYTLFGNRIYALCKDKSISLDLFTKLNVRELNDVDLIFFLTNINAKS